ncbi:putative COP9 signalosome subunit 7 [Talaromyces proteolyticus]|uniref:COP9 signalosome subunit 7 n=1 Tax=Talaromyces proteolyticus TaxID=1131652 RepID=A0AAD4PYH4_9EURO|nr:putative COP9 signalosome subunit 7 [Talaromyces proteolyticus]KAH8697739.1 putative COP9 signalosome subunit 7 [Talaromyces proteolyticus]
MELAQSRALEALQPFIHLTISSTASSPRFIANIITNATSSPNTFVFAELLQTPAVQSLRSPETPEEYRGYLKLLEIFAWGTWQEYQSTPGLPSLSKEQESKLRLLSLLTLSSTVRPLTYQALMDALSIPNSAELESLVTTAIYSSLIKARLSPASSPPTVNVTAVAPLRDVPPQAVSAMISILTEWEGRCGDVINGIEAEIAKIQDQAVKNRRRERECAQLLEQAIADKSGNPGARKNARSKAAGLSGDDIDEDDGYFDNGSDGGVDTLGSRMDIDEGSGANQGRGTGVTATRQAKRLLGVGRKS